MPKAASLPSALLKAAGCSQTPFASEICQRATIFEGMAAADHSTKAVAKKPSNQLSPPGNSRVQSEHNYLQKCCCCSCCHLELLLICLCFKPFLSWWHAYLRNGGGCQHLIRSCLLGFSSTTGPHTQSESGMDPLLLAGCSITLRSSGHMSHESLHMWDRHAAKLVQQPSRPKRQKELWRWGQLRQKVVS